MCNLMCHIENALQVDVVLNASFLSSFGGQVGEPDDRNPVLEMWRTDALEHLPLLWSHKTCRWADKRIIGNQNAAANPCECDTVVV